MIIKNIHILSLILFTCFGFAQNSNNYHIFLLKQKHRASYFTKYNNNNSFNIKSYRTKEGNYIFIAGNFDVRAKADSLVPMIKELGFENARIIDDNELRLIVGQNFNYNETVTFTIQLSNTKKNSDLSLFSKLSNVEEYKDPNGNYIYLTGRYIGYKTAKEDWKKIVAQGFQDAFIMNVDRYNSIGVK